MTKIRRALWLAFASAIVALVGAVPSYAAPRLDVNAHVTFDREYTWAITKVAHNPSLTLSVGESYTETYTVTATNTGFVDSNWKAQDGLALHGNTKTVTSVTAELTGGIIPTVSCPSLPSSASSVVCSWGPVALPDGSPRTVTGTFNFSDGTSITNSYAFDFTGKDSLPGQPVETDRCVDVVDTYAGLLGNVCADPANPGQTFTFTYTRTIGPFTTCGDYTVENTASVTDDALHPTSSSANVNVHVPCAGGCTLTQGYWKTHSRKGPAPYDVAWANLGDADGDGVAEQESENFFSSGKTWYELFWTPPAGGNGYLILAHQYMAAKLNLLDGASSTPAVNSAMAWAEAFFVGKTPATTLSKALRADAVANAGTLGAYNSGGIGPGHCDESPSSSE